MLRTELREHIFKMLFQIEFNEAADMPEHVKLYCESLEGAADKDKDFIPISSQETSHFTAQVICPIITEGDAVGAVIITSRNENVKMGEVEQKLASAAAGFLGRQLEQ